MSSATAGDGTAPPAPRRRWYHSRIAGPAHDTSFSDGRRFGVFAPEQPRFCPIVVVIRDRERPRTRGRGDRDRLGAISPREPAGRRSVDDSLEVGRPRMTEELRPDRLRAQEHAVGIVVTGLEQPVAAERGLDAFAFGLPRVRDCIRGTRRTRRDTARSRGSDTAASSDRGRHRSAATPAPRGRTVPPASATSGGPRRRPVGPRWRRRSPRRSRHPRFRLSSVPEPRR